MNLKPGKQTSNLEFLSLDDLTLIALVDSPKITSWDEFVDDLEYLGMGNKVMDLSQVVFPVDTPKFMLDIIAPYADGRVVTGASRQRLFKEYQKQMPHADHHLATVWHILDMWCLSTNQMKIVSEIDGKKITNYKVLRRLLDQHTPLYKPSRFSWTKFWSLCAIEMQASRKYYESVSRSIESVPETV